MIDCSRADFSCTTGIPKVTLNYLENGYEWGRLNGVEVIPVVPGSDGLFVVHPVPGANAPEALKSLDVRTFYQRVVLVLEKLAHYGGRYTKDILHHALLLVASIIRIPGAHRRAEALVNMYDRLVRQLEEFFRNQATRRTKIEPEPGDILFSPAYWHDVPPEEYRTLRAQGVSVFILVHDLLPISHAGYYNSPWCDLFRNNIEAALQSANGFFCVSTCTLDSLLNFARKCGFDEPQAEVAYHGFDKVPGSVMGTETSDMPTPAELVTDESIAKLKTIISTLLPPLLMVGTIEPKKGHIVVLETLERKWSSGYRRPLIIIGNPGWLHDAIIQRIRRSPHFGSRLFWLQGLGDASVAYAYEHCHALIFASIAEGFGLPMVEALAYGKPVFALKTDISYEILGDFGLYFDDATDLGILIDKMESSAAYAEALERVEPFRWPTWKERASCVFDRLVTLASAQPKAAR